MARLFRPQILVALVVLCVPISAANTSNLNFATWINGTSEHEPAMQVQRINADTYAIRQSFASSSNAPFLYLLFGNERALLIDTGDIGAPVRQTTDGIVSEWLKETGRTAIPLVVAHTHSHTDHFAGDASFSNRPDTTVIGLATQDVADFFGIFNWPEGTAQFDLGGRVLDILAVPGHEAAHIAIYDERTKLMFSGDTVLPGNVLVPFDTFQNFRLSINRLAKFCATHQVKAFLGGHIEMRAAPGLAYEMNAPSHPDERRLELAPETINEIKTAIDAMADEPTIEVHNSFVIVPLPHEIMEPYEYHE